jgi:hypothetical protein
VFWVRMKSSREPYESLRAAVVTATHTRPRGRLQLASIVPTYGPPLGDSRPTKPPQTRLLSPRTVGQRPAKPAHRRADANDRRLSVARVCACVPTRRKCLLAGGIAVRTAIAYDAPRPVRANRPPTATRRRAISPMVIRPVLVLRQQLFTLPPPDLANRTSSGPDDPRGSRAAGDPSQSASALPPTPARGSRPPPHDGRARPALAQSP